MGIDRPDRGIDAVQHPLRLAEGVGIDDGCAAGVAIDAPPLAHFIDDFTRIAPAVDRQAEGRFGDENIAAHRLERRARRIRLRLVVAGNDPHFAAIFKPHLRRPEYVPGRMQRNLDAIDRRGLTIRERLDIGRRAQAPPRHVLTLRGDEVMAMACGCMIGVGVRDNRAVDGTPRIDIEISGGAVQPGRLGADKIQSVFLGKKGIIVELLIGSSHLGKFNRRASGCRRTIRWLYSAEIRQPR